MDNIDRFRIEVNIVTDIDMDIDILLLILHTKKLLDFSE